MRKLAIGVALLLQTFAGTNFSPPNHLVSILLAWTAPERAGSLTAALTGRTAGGLTPIPSDSSVCRALDGSRTCVCDGNCFITPNSCGCT